VVTRTTKAQLQRSADNSECVTERNGDTRSLDVERFQTVQSKDLATSAGEKFSHRGIHANVVCNEQQLSREQFHNDSSLEGYRVPRCGTGVQNHSKALQSSVDKSYRTDRNCSARGSVSFVEGGFDVRTPDCDSSSLICRRPLACLLNSDPGGVEGALNHHSCMNVATSHCISPRHCEDPHIVDQRSPCNPVGSPLQRRSVRLRSNSLRELSSSSKPPYVNNAKVTYQKLFESSLGTTQPLLSPRQHGGPVLVCDTPSSLYGLSYRLRQIQYFTNESKLRPSRSGVVNLASV